MIRIDIPMPESCADCPNKDDYSVADLGLRFTIEDEWQAQGKALNPREVLKEYRLRKQGMEQVSLFG